MLRRLVKKKLVDNLCVTLRWFLTKFADGREVEEEKEQNIAVKDWFRNTHEGDIQQVSSISNIVLYILYDLIYIHIGAYK